MQILFQFHYGSIISLLRSHCLHAVQQISIPLWFDYKKVNGLSLGKSIKFQFHYGSIISENGDCERYATSVFQFHYGSIIRKPNIRYFISFFSISIPLWFDYKVCMLDYLCTDIHFNSTMVRL